MTKGGIKRRSTKGQVKDSKLQKKHKRKAAKYGGGRRVHETFGSQTIKDNWDKDQTLRQNYIRLGLVMDVNEDTKGGRGLIQRQSLRGDAPTAMLSDHLEEIRNLPKPAPYVAKSMSIKEQTMLKMLTERHGEDYKAMSRDIRINLKQETPGVLEKRIKLWKQMQLV